MSEPSEQASGAKFENRGLWIASVSAVVAGVLWWKVGVQAAVLLLASVVLLTAIWLFWVSLQALVGQSKLTLDEALGLAAPSAAEEQKRATLRILKDLEYERSVGKLSEEDYHALVQHYRAEAKGLLRDLDDSLGPLRERAERRLAKRLKAVKQADATSQAEPVDPTDGEAPLPSDTASDAQQSAASEHQSQLEQLAEAVEESLAAADTDDSDPAVDDEPANGLPGAAGDLDHIPNSDETSGVREHARTSGTNDRRAAEVPRRNSNPPPKPKLGNDGIDGASKAKAKATEEDAQ